MNALLETFQGFRYVIEITVEEKTLFYMGYRVEKDGITKHIFSTNMSKAIFFYPISLNMKTIISDVKELYPDIPIRKRKMLPIKQHFSSKFETKGK
jgi:hypothetical protein